MYHVTINKSGDNQIFKGSNAIILKDQLGPKLCPCWSDKKGRGEMRVNELFGWIMPFIVKDVQNITKEHSMVEEDMDLEEEQDKDKEKDEPLKKKKKWNPEKLRVYL